MKKKTEQIDLEANKVKKEDVEYTEMVRKIVTYKTENLMVRSTPEGIEKAKDQEIPDREKWLRRKIKIIGDATNGVDFDRDFKKIYKKIFN